VEVKHASGEVLQLGDPFLKTFNIICATNQLRSTLFKLDSKCRELGIYFIAADSFCLSGYFFTDLCEFRYNVVDKENIANKGKSKEVAEPPTKKTRRDFTAEFVSLENALSTKWSKLDRRTAKLYYGMQLVYALREAKFNNNNTDKEECNNKASEIWKQLVADHDGDEGVLSEQYKVTLVKNFGCEFVPVSAVVGGIAAQEMIKILAADDAPINNFFFYDSVDGTGLVEKIGS